ncbi:MAG: protoporphyrinogen oxidase HemJ [Pseudohongiellaceae bacterium]
MLWIKAFHVIAVICWFAGLFYLPRLYVYHAMSDDQTSRDRFKIMERKLYRGIMTPSAVATVILGFWLVAYNPQFYLQSGWMQAKLALVSILLLYHVMCRYHLKQFQTDANTHGHVYFRWFNEFPVILLIAIVILVVVRPF